MKAQAEVWTERNLYLPTSDQRVDVRELDQVRLKTPSTYRLGGTLYESTAYRQCSGVLKLHLRAYRHLQGLWWCVESMQLVAKSNRTFWKKLDAIVN